jgi:DNA-binding CsgD family transcriptional regulator
VDKLAETNLKKEIEDRKQIEQKLRARDKELANKAHELEEVNNALTVLLQRTENSRKDVEDKILFNMKELVAPYIDKLKSSLLDDRQSTYLNIIESNILNIISPFGQKLSVKYAALTPSELHIANLIKEGMATKDISELMGLSDRTVDFHRKNIRKKLGINNKKANLRSLLLSM